MITPNPFTMWYGLLNAWQINAATGTRLVQTLTAAETVIAARSEIIHEAIASPATANYGELAPMGPEKSMAFSQSLAVLARACLGMQTAWWRQVEAASRLMAAGRAPTVGEFAGLWIRGTEISLSNFQVGARAGRDALAPVSRQVATNVRRLRPRKID